MPISASRCASMCKPRCVRTCGCWSCRRRWMARPLRACWASAPRITSAGKSFAVDIALPDCEPQASRSGPRPRQSISQARSRERSLACSMTDPGDILAFLPGQGEIRRTERLLLDAGLPGGTRVLPLYGDLPAAQQDAALVPAACRPPQDRAGHQHRGNQPDDRRRSHRRGLGAGTPRALRSRQRA